MAMKEQRPSVMQRALATRSVVSQRNTMEPVSSA
jgi:hypothetical protein